MSGSLGAERPVKLLSIDGGGVRGLSALLILQEIVDNTNMQRKQQGLEPQHPWEMFDMMGGTSTGGLIAIMLGRLRFSVEQAIEEYIKISSRAFTPKTRVRRGWSMLRFRLLDPKFEAGPLETVIKDVVGPDWSTELLRDDSDKACKTFVVSHNTSSHMVSVLRSYRNPIKQNTWLDTMKIWQAARATSAALTFFDPIEIEGVTFSDGGLMNNNPIAILHAEAAETFNGREQVIVSLGTGKSTMKTFRPSLFTITKQLAEIATDTEQEADHFTRRDGMRAAIEGRYFRFNVPEIGDQDMSESSAEALTLLKTSTFRYLDDVETQMKLGICSERLHMSMTAPKGLCSGCRAGIVQILEKYADERIQKIKITGQGSSLDTTPELQAETSVGRSHP